MKNILSYLDKSASEFPDKTAVASAQKSLTFQSLKDRAQHYACFLIDCDVAGSPVAVFANRGPECIVGFLAALYAGAYYLPLDPEMPPHKLQAIMEDSAAKVILGTSDCLALVEAAGYGSLFAKVELEKAAEQSDIDFPGLQAGPDTPLCLLYTSGSTGKPKGVLKSHGAVISFVEAFIDEFGFTSDEVIGNQTPFFFDASAKDLYLMLATGATLEIIPPEKFVFPVTLIEYLNEKKITYACWVPTALSVVTQLKTFTKVMPETLRRVFFVGEVFPRKQLLAWVDALPQLEYVNLYGSTELAGICCFYRIDTSAEIPDPLPMGKPLGNSCVRRGDYADGTLVLEKDTVPSDGPKEVCVCSPALALEYFGDKEKTAEKFVQADGKRWLRTGDLARYDAQGNLVFASRSDFQIKHMGRRIELGEIESVADALPYMQRCACVYNAEKKRIVMFCQVDSAAQVDAKSIRADLRAHLSEYMVPNKVTLMEQLPYNANGKIDRPALKALL